MFFSIFSIFWQVKLAKTRFSLKNLSVQKKCTNFVPDKKVIY